MGGRQTRSLSALGKGPAPQIRGGPGHRPAGGGSGRTHLLLDGPSPPGRGRSAFGRQPRRPPLASPGGGRGRGGAGRGGVGAFSGRAGLRRDRGGGGSVSDLLPPRVRRPSVPIAPRGCPAAGPLAPGWPVPRRSGRRGAAAGTRGRPIPGKLRPGPGRRSQRGVPGERPEGAGGRARVPLVSQRERREAVCPRPSLLLRRLLSSPGETPPRSRGGEAV